MQNLAGKDDCDRYIQRELVRCRIPVVNCECSTGEVPSALEGKLGPFRMWRAWSYWVIKGPVPLSVAQELYDDPVGKTDIRVDGHCGCPAPEGYHVNRYDSGGKQLVLDKTGEEQERYLYFMDQGFVSESKFNSLHWISFESDLVRLTERATVNCYHIDTEIGLRLFADMIWKHQLDK